MKKLIALSSLTLPLIAIGVASPAFADAQPNSGIGFQVQKKRQFSFVLPARDATLRPIVDKMIAAMNAQGRFSYVAIEIPGSNSQEAVKEQVVAFLKQNAAELASKGATADQKFGDVVITKDKIQAMLSSSYIIFPTRTADAKEGGFLDLDVINVETGLKEKAVPPVQLPLQDLFTKKPEGQALPPSVRVTMAGDKLKPSGFASFTASMTQLPMKAFGKTGPTDEEVALNEMLAAARRLDSFLLRTHLAGDEQPLHIPAGREVGVELDSTFIIERKVQKNAPAERLGWLKVRSADAQQSGFQTISSAHSLQEGDLLVEHPQMGLDMSTRFGIAPFDPSGGNALAPALVIAGEYNLAPLTNVAALSETYVTGEINLIQDMSILSGQRNTGVHYMFGAEKRFTLGHFLVSPGLRAGLLGSNVDLGSSGGINYTVNSSGLGGGPTLGLDFQVNPDLKLGLDAGYILGSPLLPTELRATDSAGNSSSASIAALSALGLLKNNTNASGPTLSFNATYSF